MFQQCDIFVFFLLFLEYHTSKVVVLLYIIIDAVVMLSIGAFDTMLSYSWYVSIGVLLQSVGVFCYLDTLHVVLLVWLSRGCFVVDETY
jgi:hypothetical protein